MQPLNQFTAFSQIQLNEQSTSENERLQKTKEFNEIQPKKSSSADATTKQYEWEIVWTNVILFSIFHILAVYGLYLTVFGGKILIFLFCYLMGIIFANGITMGAHRLWAHRCFKAKLPLQVLLVILQTASFQNSVFIWVRDHRLHHKYTDTDADPHNAKRGFFFSHIGWLFLRKHQDVLDKGRAIDMSDIKADKLLMWQHKNYGILMPIFAFVIPSYMVHCVFNESAMISILFGGIMRYTVSVNFTWLVNSAAHIWGMKPYDKSIGPVENKFVSFFSIGEGWHNYHHVFPWDYKAAELGNYSLNLTLALIHVFARIGWAYDMKSVSPQIVERRVARTGDGSRKAINTIDEGDFNNVDKEREAADNHLWGWGDREMAAEDMLEANIENKDCAKND